MDGSIRERADWGTSEEEWGKPLCFPLERVEFPQGFPHLLERVEQGVEGQALEGERRKAEQEGVMENFLLHFLVRKREEEVERIPLYCQIPLPLIQREQE